MDYDSSHRRVDTVDKWKCKLYYSYMPKGLTGRLGFTPIILLVLLLLLVGLGGAGTYWYFNLRDSDQPQIPQASPSPTVAFSLVVDSPSDQTVVEDNRLTVSGMTAPNTAVTIFTESDESIVQSDTSGKFEGIITLTMGINNLVVSAFSDSGEEKTVVMDVIYDET